MSKKNKPASIEDKIKDFKNDIIANAKDGTWTKKALTHLINLQKQLDIEAVELIVPVKEIKETLDFDSYTFKRTPRGILFTAKGGLHVFIENRLQSTYEMVNRIFELYAEDTQDEERKQLIEAYAVAVAYVLQAPIFTSLSEQMLYDVASKILSGFNEYVAEYVDNAELKPETEADIAHNELYNNAIQAVEDAIEAPLPPEV